MNPDLCIAGLIVVLIGLLLFIWIDNRSKLRIITNKLNWIAKKTIDIKPKKD